MMSIMSVFFMSTQPLVIAPRPNVAVPNFETVGPVSNPGRVFQMHDPQGVHRFHNQIVKLIGIGTAAAHRRTDSSRFTVCPAESFSTKVSSRVFYSPFPRRNFADGIVPRNVLPFSATRAAHQGFSKRRSIHDLLL